MLPNLSGLESLTSVGLNPAGTGDDLNIGNLGFGGNDSLQNLIGLNNLQTIGGDLNINLNWNLQTLFGLQNLSSIGGNLHLFYNDQITNLQGLESIESIGGNIEIASCLNLETLQGIENIEGNSIEGIDISMNPLLSECDIQSICSFLISPTGIVTFESNAPGCNSQEEVEAACLTGLSELEAAIPITIFPNPANETISITANNHQQIIVVNIYDLAGEVVLAAKQGETDVDIRSLNPGMYLVEVLQKNHKYRSKLIIP